MPFKADRFLESVEDTVGKDFPVGLRQACDAYKSLTTAKQKAQSIRGTMVILDQTLDETTRYQIMEACGRQCIGASILEHAHRLQKESHDLDDLLVRLNNAHIGGGHLRRDGNTIHAEYNRCYCGSVSQSREVFSDTYCHCSCGWYRQLFESLLGKPVEVELLGSILQGADCCEFRIHL
jgi:hypothetical protein